MKLLSVGSSNFDHYLNLIKLSEFFLLLIGVIYFKNFNLVSALIPLSSQSKSHSAMKLLFNRKWFSFKKHPCKFNWRKLTVFSSMPCLIKLATLNYLLYIHSILISNINCKFMCCTKWSTVINSIYSRQQVFSYNYGNDTDHIRLDEAIRLNFRSV